MTKTMVKLGMLCGILSLGLVVGCGDQRAPGGVSGEAGAAIMPNANVIMFYDMQAAQNTAIGKAMEAMSEDFGKVAEQMQEQNLHELRDKFQQATGLTDNDILSVLFAVDLSNIDFDAPEPPALDDLDLVAAISLKKSVSGAQLAEALQTMAAEEGEEVEVRETTHQGIAVYTFSGSALADSLDMKELSMAMVGKDRVCLVGPTAALQAAVERTVGGSKASLSPAMQDIEKSVQAGSQFYVVFAMTEAMKAEAAEAAASEYAEEMEKAMGTLEGASLSLLMGNEAKVALTGIFGAEEDAAAMAGFFENMVISSIRMFGGMMLGPRPLPAMQSLQSSHDGSQATLSFTISEQDIITLQEMVQEQMQGMMHMH